MNPQHNRFHRQIQNHHESILGVLRDELSVYGVPVFQTPELNALIVQILTPAHRFNVTATTRASAPGTVVLKADNCLVVHRNHALADRVLAIAASLRGKLKADVSWDRQSGLVQVITCQPAAIDLAIEEPDELVAWFYSFVDEADQAFTALRGALQSEAAGREENRDRRAA